MIGLGGQGTNRGINDRLGAGQICGRCGGSECEVQSVSYKNTSEILWAAGQHYQILISQFRPDFYINRKMLLFLCKFVALTIRVF